MRGRDSFDRLLTFAGGTARVTARSPLPSGSPARVRASRYDPSRSAPEPMAAIEAFVDAYNDDPKPFVGTASVETILATVDWCRAILETHNETRWKDRA